MIQNSLICKLINVQASSEKIADKISLFSYWQFLEDLFLGSQWSIILGYRRLSVKSLFHQSSLVGDFLKIQPSPSSINLYYKNSIL